MKRVSKLQDKQLDGEEITDQMRDHAVAEAKRMEEEANASRESYEGALVISGVEDDEVEDNEVAEEDEGMLKDDELPETPAVGDEEAVRGEGGTRRECEERVPATMAELLKDDDDEKEEARRGAARRYRKKPTPEMKATFAQVCAAAVATPED